MKLLKDWLSFEGRLRRSDFWVRVLAVVLSVLFVGMPLLLGAGFTRAPLAIEVIALLVGLAVNLLLGLINLSTHARRWHDRDKSGWWILIGLIPIVGPIWSIVECGFLDGTPGPNRFGPSPKSDTELAGRAGASA